MVDSISLRSFTPEQQAELKAQLDKAKSIEDKTYIFETYKKAYGIVTPQNDNNGVNLSPQKNITTKTTTSFSAKESGLSDNEIAELVKQNLITYDRETGKCTLNNGQTIANIKQALDVFNKTSPDENFTGSETKTIDIPTGQGKTEEASALLQGKTEVTTKSRDYKFDVTTTETTTEDYKVPTKEDLDKLDLNKRSVRKELKGQYRQALESWLDADPSHEEIMKDSLAGEKYSKKINKEIAKIDKKYANKPDALVKEFFESENSFATKDMKDNYKAFMLLADNALTTDEQEYNKLIAKGNTKEATAQDKENAYKAENVLKLRQDICQKLNIKLSDLQGNKQVRQNAIRSFYAEAIGKDVIDGIKQEIAKDTVLNKRTPEQKIEDREYFLKYMSKREVRDHHAEQNIENTTLYLTEKEAKQAEKQNKAWKKSGDSRYNPKAQFNFVGKAGLAKIKNRPDIYCKPVENGEKADYIVDGKGYKFDSKFYSDRIGEEYGNHATLSEVRNFAGENGNKKYLGKDGNNTSLEGLIGNGNGKVGYFENRRERLAIKATGRSVDKDYSNQLKFVDGLTKGGITLATAAATAGLGLAIGGTVSGIAQGATQTFTEPGQKVWVDKTVEKCTTQTITNGRPITVIKYHEQGGYYVTGDEQTFVKDGQQSSYNDKANPLNAFKLAGPAAGIATIIGAATSKKRSKGHTDDVIDLRPSTRTNVTNRKTENHSITRTSMKKVMYDINGNNQLNSSYDSENPVTVNTIYKTVGSEAEDRDLTKMDNRNVNRDITNETQLANVNKNKAQAVFANTEGNKLEVTPTVDKDGKCDYDKPKEVIIHDSSNGAEHIFKYVLLDQSKALNDNSSLAKAEGPFYELVSVTDKDGNDISNLDKQKEIKSLKVEPLESEFRTITDKNGNEITIEIRRNDYKFYQNEHHPGNNHTSINNKKAGPKFWTGRR